MRQVSDHPNGPAKQMDKPQANRLLRGRLGGAPFAVLWGFTPRLVVVLAGVGLSVATGVA